LCVQLCFSGYKNFSNALKAKRTIKIQRQRMNFRAYCALVLTVLLSNLKA
jgi:hypothetical protein